MKRTLAALSAALFVLAVYNVSISSSAGVSPSQRQGAGGRPRALQRRITETITSEKSFDASVCQTLTAQLEAKSLTDGCVTAKLQGVEYNTIIGKALQACLIQFAEDDKITGFTRSLDLVCAPEGTK